MLLNDWREAKQIYEERLENAEAQRRTRNLLKNRKESEQDRSGWLAPLVRIVQSR